MREESHLDDMRAAIRGDFERLEERRGEQELMRLSDNGEAHAEESPSLPEQEQVPPAIQREPEPALAPEPELEPELEPHDELAIHEGALPEGAPAAEPEPAAQAAQTERSWLDRFLGR